MVNRIEEAEALAKSAVQAARQNVTNVAWGILKEHEMRIKVDQDGPSSNASFVMKIRTDGLSSDQIEEIRAAVVRGIHTDSTDSFGLEVSSPEATDSDLVIKSAHPHTVDLTTSSIASHRVGELASKLKSNNVNFPGSEKFRSAQLGG